MGKQRTYRVWVPEEEEALRLGVQKHGLGAWELIRTDDAFPSLHGRTGVQLKDKWRNLVKFKHLTQAETACLATKIQKETWKRDDEYGYEAEEQPQNYSNFGTGPLPSVAVCCQQEIHATLLAKEAHSIQIEANRALSAALAGIDRDVEGAEELMRNAVMVANQASEKAMKAKRHVVIARRRLAIALLSAEREVENEKLEERQRKQNGDEPLSTSCSRGSSAEHDNVFNQRGGQLAARGDESSEQRNSVESEAGTDNSTDKLDNASSSSAFACLCGTKVKEGFTICTCKGCGAGAHQECLVMQATTEGRTFTKPYFCKSCKAKDAAAASPTASETAEESREELHLLGAESAKRKATEESSPCQETKRGRVDFKDILGGLLGDFQGGPTPQLNSAPPLAQDNGGGELGAKVGEKQSPVKSSSTPDSISSAISFSLVKAPQTCIPLVKEGHEVISENTLLDHVLQDMTDLDDSVGLHW